MSTRDGQAIGGMLWSTTQVVQRAFDRLLAEAGGNRPLWTILKALHDDPAPSTQREIAQRIELREATLTHHLRAMEDAGLVTRVRSAENRRIVRVELTAAGGAQFERLLAAAIAFDDEMRQALDGDTATVLRGLRTLRDRFADSDRPPPPL